MRTLATAWILMRFSPLAPLVRAGVLDGGDVAAFEALRRHNPLLFELVLKRRVRWRGGRLADAVFETRRHFIAAGA
jgi:hypothetical protein